MNKENLGAKIKTLRENRGMSQSEVARHLGIHRPTVSEIERGNRSLSAEEVLKLAVLFNITTDELLKEPEKRLNQIPSERKLITFFRHGEATDDVYNQYGGWGDPELSPEGVRKAYDTISRINKHSFDMIFTSPLKRARKMAEIFSNSLNLDLKVLQYLKERNTYGLLCGVNKDVAQKKYPELVKAYNNGEYVLASETAEDFAERVKVLAKYLTKTPYNNSICITHGKLLKQFSKDYLGKEIEETEDCGSMTLEITKKGFNVVSTNGITFKK